MGKSLLIYTEGGLELGLGNIYRCLSLSKALKAERPGLDISFLSSSPENVLSIISDNGFRAVHAAKEELLPAILESGADCLLIDVLGTEENFVRPVKEKGMKVVIVGNDTPANHCADIVVNAIIGTGLRNRTFRDSYGTLNLWGPEFLVLRDEFESLRDSYRYSGELRNVVLLFGGSDQSDFTRKVLRTLSGHGLGISVIVGRSYEHYPELEAEAAGMQDVTLYHNISNVSEIYRKSDFLFTSPGTALFEGLCIGMPAVSFYQNDSQMDVFGDFFTCNRFTDETAPLAMMASVYEGYDAFRKERDFFNVGGGRKQIIESIAQLI